MLNFTVGPVMSDNTVRTIGAEQVPYFRTPEFSAVMLENEKLMKKFAKAGDNARVVFITGSGTAAMEATVMNVFDKTDKVLVVNGGSFGQRFVELCQIHEIPYEELYKKGYRGIVFDVDNTLVEHGAPVTERAVALFERLRKTGYDTCIISNNKEPRVRPLAEAVHSKYVSDAKKPSPKNYIKAMECMKTDVNTTFFVGDQLFTDVWGANRAGMMTILVKPIDKHEEIQIVLKRYLEKIVLHFYKKQERKRYGRN